MHSGGQDANGGHVNKETGIYHCHADDCVLPNNIPVDEDVLDPPDGVPSEPLTIAGSWGATKKWARDEIYGGENETFYCGCEYTASGFSGGSINQTSCSYNGQAESYKKRAEQLEWNMSYQHHSCPLIDFNAGMMDCLNALSQVEHVVKDTI